RRWDICAALNDTHKQPAMPIGTRRSLHQQGCRMSQQPIHASNRNQFVETLIGVDRLFQIDYKRSDTSALCSQFFQLWSSPWGHFVRSKSSTSPILSPSKFSLRAKP